MIFAALCLIIGLAMFLALIETSPVIAIVALTYIIVTSLFRKE
jgi:Skp family chaperone for outer membrane proteins